MKKTLQNQKFDYISRFPFNLKQLLSLYDLKQQIAKHEQVDKYYLKMKQFEEQKGKLVNIQCSSHCNFQIMLSQVTFDKMNVKQLKQQDKSLNQLRKNNTINEEMFIVKKISPFHNHKPLKIKEIKLKLILEELETNQLYQNIVDYLNSPDYYQLKPKELWAIMCDDNIISKTLQKYDKSAQYHAKIQKKFANLRQKAMTNVNQFNMESLNEESTIGATQSTTNQFVEQSTSLDYFWLNKWIPEI